MAGSVAQEIEAMTTIGENPPRLPKRFYKSASVVKSDGACLISLDGKIAKTRGGNPLSAVTSRLADAVAAEWNAQGDHIDFAGMPMTRFAMTVRDLGSSDAAKWRGAVMSFFRSDLVCYRAREPDALVRRQAAAWDPLLDWASLKGLAMKTTSGVTFIEQPPPTLAAAGKMLDAMSSERLLGVKSAAEIAGSGVIALALDAKAFPAEALFEASRIDDLFQAERWGRDQEAFEREERLRLDFLNVSRFIRHL